MTLKSVLGYVSDYVKNLLKKILDYEEGEIDDDDDDLSIEWPNFAADQSISSRRIKKEIHQFLNLLHRSSMGWGKWHFSMPLFSLITTTLCMYTPIDRSHKGLYCLTFAFFYLFFPLLDCILLLLSRIVSFYEVNQIPRNSSLVGHIFQKVFKFISQIYFVGNMKIIDTTQLFISYRACSHQELIQDIKFPTCWKACDLSQSTVDSFLVSFFLNAWFGSTLFWFNWTRKQGTAKQHTTNYISNNNMAKSLVGYMPWTMLSKVQSMMLKNFKIWLEIWNRGPLKLTTYTIRNIMAIQTNFYWKPWKLISTQISPRTSTYITWTNISRIFVG